MKHTFEIKDKFYLDGNEFKIISGGIHYFRVVPEYWKDRLMKLKAMGCNTVETYVAWNMHEPKKGQFNFEGMCNLKEFIEIAADLGLYVIVRPSPYICAEWEFGGLPAWLLAEDGMRLRGNFEPYMTYVREYYKELFKILSPLQVTNGGPIILFQIENEYGYYGNDKEYLNALKQIMIDNGVDVPFVTSDGPWGEAIEAGNPDGVLATGNFGSNTVEQFRQLSLHTDGGPLMCMEFWVGWFDAWGNDNHATSDLETNKKDFEDLLRLGNANIYMFHGGTNFGFMNGSNYSATITPDVTSYDYDGVVSEAGDITEKYKAFQKIASKYNKTLDETEIPPIKRKAFGKLNVSDKVSLFEVIDDISEKSVSSYPKSMEKLGQGYGYTLYRSNIGKSRKIDNFRIVGGNDRALIYANREHVATIYDKELLEEHTFELKESPEVTLDILMENLGRVNFGPFIEEQRKGIDKGVLINGHYQSGWEMYTLPLDNVSKIDFSKRYVDKEPAFYKFELEIEEPADTFVDTKGFAKGNVFVNGFNLGRYWEIGPQKRLYLPAPLLKKGKNEIVVFETEGRAADSITLTDIQDLGNLRRDMYGYLFVYFAGEKYEDGEQIYFGISKDGYNYEDLNNNKPILMSTLGEKGVRDPYIIRSADGDKFFIIATDLKINGNGNWNKCQRQGSQSVMIWESEDLVNWSEQRMVKIARDDAGCTWAPESTYDKTTGDYIVYWASRVAEDDFAKQRVYCSRTKDFIHFTEAKVYIEKANDVIDTTIIEHKGRYYRFSKDETTKCISADRVDNLADAKSTKIASEYLDSKLGVEGPAIYKFNNEDKWCLLVDNYGGIGYYPLITNNLDKGVYTTPGVDYKMPSRARHGSVIPITREEYDNLMEQFGNK